MEIIRKSRPQLGSFYETDGVTFGIYLSGLNDIKLQIFEKIDGEAIFEYNLKRGEASEGDFFWVKVSDVAPEYFYTWSVTNEAGTQFLIDPYAYEVLQSP